MFNPEPHFTTANVISTKMIAYADYYLWNIIVLFTFH